MQKRSNKINLLVQRECIRAIGLLGWGKINPCHVSKENIPEETETSKNR